MPLFTAPEEDLSSDLYGELYEHPDCCGLDLVYGFPSGFKKTGDYRGWLRNRKIVRKILPRFTETAPNIFVILSHYQADNFGDILTKEFKYRLVHKSYNANSRNDLYYYVWSEQGPKRKKKSEVNIRHRSGPISTL